MQRLKCARPKCDNFAMPLEPYCVDHLESPPLSLRHPIRTGQKYRYTTKRAREGLSKPRWYEMAVIHYDPERRKAWVKMTESGRHRVIDVDPFVFKEVR